MLGKEPIEADNPLMEIKDSTKLVITPHVAWGTVEARTRLMDEVYENIACECGFSDSNTFGDTFKRVFKQSPSSYRKTL